MSKKSSKKNNNVAKHMNTYNRPSVQKDRKNEYSRKGKNKFKY